MRISAAASAGCDAAGWTEDMHVYTLEYKRVTRRSTAAQAHWLIMARTGIPNLQQHESRHGLRFEFPCATQRERLKRLFPETES